MLTSASLDWLPVVQDLFLEGASPARIAAWLDGHAETHASYVVIRRMGAIDGFDATILVRDGRATSFTVWYRDVQRPTLAHAESVLGRASREPTKLFELVFADAARPIDDLTELLVVASADGYHSDPSERRLLVGLALNVTAWRR